MIMKQMPPSTHGAHEQQSPYATSTCLNSINSFVVLSFRLGCLIIGIFIHIITPWNRIWEMEKWWMHFKTLTRWLALSYPDRNDSFNDHSYSTLSELWYTYISSSSGWSNNNSTPNNFIFNDFILCVPSTEYSAMVFQLLLFASEPFLRN